MLRDIFGARVQPRLTPGNIKTLESKITAYIDRNSNILLSLDLSTRYSFGDADRQVIYEFLGITEDEMEQQIKLSKYIYDNNKNQSNPFYCATILVSHYLWKANKKDTAKLVLNYMSLMMYVSIHKGRFKYAPNKQIMDYTIAHLGPEFRIKQVPSLFAFIEDNTAVAYNAYQSRIDRCDDKDITWIIDALFTRLKAKMVKIAMAFRKNYESGAYLNADSDNYSEEDYHEMDNNSFVIERLATKVHLKLLDRRFDRRFLKYSVTSSDISLSKLTNLLEDVLDDDEQNEVKNLVSAIIEYYLIYSQKDITYIGKGDFIVYMKSAYASNSNAQQMIYIKDILEVWVNRYMVASGRNRYGRTARLAYKRALLLFFLFVINAEAKIS